jgi:hypothetical protein
MDTQFILIICNLVLTIMGRIYDMWKEMESRKITCALCGGRCCWCEEDIQMKSDSVKSDNPQ